MAFAILITPGSLTAAQYAECLSRLEQASVGTPPDRLSHTCYGSEEHLCIFEVWESREAFERYWARFRLLLEQGGMEPGQPEVSEVHQMRPVPVSRRRTLEVLSTLPPRAWFYRAWGQGSGA